MNNIVLILIYPLMLGKVKAYQNLSLITSCVIWLIIFTLFWFDNNKNNILSHTIAFLMLLSCLSIISFVLLSLPFLLSKKTEIATITNGVLFLNIEQRPVEYDLQQVRFLLNIDSKHLENKDLNTEMAKKLTMWGNYIVIPSENSLEDIYIQFRPDEDIFKVLPQLKIESYKYRPLLMGNTKDLASNFMGMLWGAS